MHFRGLALSPAFLAMAYWNSLVLLEKIFHGKMLGQRYTQSVKPPHFQLTDSGLRGTIGFVNVKFGFILHNSDVFNNASCVRYNENLGKITRRENFLTDILRTT